MAARPLDNEAIAALLEALAAWLAEELAGGQSPKYLVHVAVAGLEYIAVLVRRGDAGALLGEQTPDLAPMRPAGTREGTGRGHGRSGRDPDREGVITVGKKERVPCGMCGGSGKSALSKDTCSRCGGSGVDPYASR
jgi:hypothetical protein